MVGDGANQGHHLMPIEAARFGCVRRGDNRRIEASEINREVDMRIQSSSTLAIQLFSGARTIFLAQ